MFKNPILLIVAHLLLIDVNAQDLVLRKEINIYESIELLSDISDIGVLDDGSFWVTSFDAGRISIFDQNGLQKKIVGRWGKGPNEYDSPSEIYIKGNDVYVWDAGNLKILRYSLSGELVEEYGGFTRSASSFVIVDSLVVFNNSGGRSRDYITVYNMHNSNGASELEPLYYFGIGMSVEDLVIGMLEGGEKISLNSSGDIYYVIPSFAGAHVIDGSMYIEREFVKYSEINLDVSRSVFSDKDDIQRGIVDGRVFKYLATNDRVLGFYEINSGYVLLVESGDYPLEKNERVSPEDERRLWFYKFSKQLDIVGGTYIPKDQEARFVDIKGDLIYIVATNSEGWVLQQYELQ